jgi:hypothetical protein
VLIFFEFLNGSGSVYRSRSILQVRKICPKYLSSNLIWSYLDVIILNYGIVSEAPTIAPVEVPETILNKCEIGLYVLFSISHNHRAGIIALTPPPSIESIL